MVDWKNVHIKRCPLGKKCMVRRRRDGEEVLEDTILHKYKVPLRKHCLIKFSPRQAIVLYYKMGLRYPEEFYIYPRTARSLKKYPKNNMRPPFNYVSRKYKYLVSVSPKSGVSSIKQIFLTTHKDEIPEYTPDHRIRNYRSIQVKDVSNPEFNDYEKILIFREPGRRLLSGFLDLVIGVSGLRRSPNLLKTLGGLKNITFEKFVTHLYEHKLPFFSYDLENYHFKEQVHIEDFPYYTKVIQTHKIDDYINFLKEKGLEVNKVTPLHKTSYTKIKIPKAWDLTGSQILIFGVPTPSSFFNQKIRDMIKEIYPYDTEIYQIISNTETSSRSLPSSIHTSCKKVPILLYN